MFVISRFEFVCLPSKFNETCFVYSFFCFCQSIAFTLHSEQNRKKMCLPFVWTETIFDGIPLNHSLCVCCRKMNPCLSESKHLLRSERVSFVSHHDIWINWPTSKAFYGCSFFRTLFFRSHDWSILLDLIWLQFWTWYFN